MGAVPVPLSAVVCGLVEALSVTLSKPEREPVVVGVKVTLIVQLAFTASSVVGQLLL
jgi:hypothetical protein